MRQAFAEAISGPETVAAATRNLVERLCRDLEQDGRGLRSAELVWWRVDGTADRIGVGTSAPVNQPKPLLRLFSERLDRLDPGFGIEVMALNALRTDRMPERQAALEDGDSKQADIARLVDSLSNCLGQGAVRRLVPHQSWLPGRAVAAQRVPPDTKSSGWLPDRPRPVRLLPRPERIEAVALLPDEPPVLLRRRGRVHRIAHADGPERIESEWWRETVPYRDYYRVEDEHGRRWWVYRAGPYGECIEPQ